MRSSLRAFVAVVALLPLAACPGSSDEPDARNVVLITLDTTRRDSLGVFGGREGITPNLDAFAAECVLYDNARTTAPLTLPAHTSMLTGLYPPRHGVRDNALTPVPRGATTLAEKAQEAGIATGAVVAAAVLSSPYGLDQGFDLYDEPERAAGDHSYAARHADEVTARATAWLEGLGADERFFLWAHYFDPHRPNDPTDELLARADGDRYLACVARMDDGVGDLLDALRARDDWDDTLVIIVADHGEARGEHGEGTHAVFVYDSTIRVPMMVRFPTSMERSEGSVEPAASVVDVFPTAIDLLGLGSAGAIDGVSLRTPPPADRGVYFESYYGRIYYGWSPLVGWADADAKYVHSTAPELYATDVDPGELRNVVAERDPAPFVAALEALSRKPALDPDAEPIDRDILAALEKMGYAGSGAAGELPGPLELDPDRPSPHTRPDELRALVMAASTSGAEPADRSRVIATLEGVLTRDPRNPWAWARLGRMLIEAEDWPRAAQALEQVRALDVPWPEDRLRLAQCYLELKRPADAAATLEETLELDADNRTALGKLVEIYQALGRTADAARAFERLESLQR